MRQILHCATARGYDIIVEPGCMARAGEEIRKITKSGIAAIVTDSNVAALYLDRVRDSLQAAGFQTPTFVFPAGERSKTHETLLRLYSFLVQNGVTRSDLIVALGGGVTGDTAGFAAATYMRGIGLVQIPTSLLAQIDSSVGGKTAVNLPEGKNLVGAFWQPRLVLCDPETLRTLPPRFWTDGMAEAVKYGCILDSGLFTLIERGEEHSRMDAMITRCIDLKRLVVEHDEREKGERMLLNFGHTMGHAIEKAYHYETFSHGEAVSMGMMLAADAGERQGVTRRGTRGRLKDVLNRLGLPVRCEKSLDELAAFALHDKKRNGPVMNVVLLRQIGEAVVQSVPADGLADYYRGLPVAGGAGQKAADR